MALASLIPHYVFGVKSSIKNSLYFIDETIVIYPAGHNLIFWNLVDKTQKIISGTPDTDGITAIALAPNKRQVAIAERLVPLTERVFRGVSPLDSKVQSPSGKDVLFYFIFCIISLYKLGFLNII